MDYRLFQKVSLASQWFDARYTPLGRLLVGLMIAAAVFATDPTRTHASVVLAGLFASFTLAFLVNLRWRPALSGRRALPAYAVAGSPMTYQVVAHNAGARAERNLVVRDRLRERFPSRQDMELRKGVAPALENWFDRRVGFLRWRRRMGLLRGGEIAPVPLANLPAGHSAEVTICFTPLRRGLVDFARLDFARADPLGLSFAATRLLLPQQLLVLPKYHPVPFFGAHQPGNTAPDHTVQHGAVHGSTEFHTLREYRAGDALRHVHWRASAKRGTHVVKLFVDGHHDALVLLVDTATDSESFEYVIEVVASLVLAATQQFTRPIELILLDERLAANGGARGRSDPQSLLETLALLTPAVSDQFPTALAQLRLDPAASVLFITADWSLSRQRFSRALVASTALSRTLIVASCTVPQASLTAHCTCLRTAHLAEDLSRFSLSSGQA